LAKGEKDVVAATLLRCPRDDRNRPGMHMIEQKPAAAGKVFDT
jgi:hypothetical protein